MKNNHVLPCNKALKHIISVVIILGIWEISALIVSDSFFLPDIPETFLALIKIISAKSFLKIIFTSFYRVILGLIVGTVLGVVFAVLCHKIDFLATILSPLISIMKATPVACIIVLLWIRFNYTQIAVLVVLLMVTPIVWQNVYDSFKSIDVNLSEVAEVFELKTTQKLRLLIIPTMLTYLLPAIVTSVGLAWKAEVAAEIMTNNNMGQQIYDFKTVSYDTASIFAWTVIIILTSIVLEKVTKYLFGRVLNELKD